MRHQLVEFLEGALVEQQFDALARRKLALLVLAVATLRSASFFGRRMTAAQFVKPVHRHYCSCHRVRTEGPRACSKLSPMSSRPRCCWTFVLATVFTASSLCAQSAPKITTPKDALGFNLGDDYMVANYTQLEAYWKKFDHINPFPVARSELVEMGRDPGISV